MPSVFFSYSHADEKLRDQLDKQLSLLKRQGIIETWHDRRIGVGQEFAGSIDAQLEACDIILLLVSPDFLDSDYCYDIEMRRAMERHEEESAIVIPVILRACMWHGAPFGKLLATPRDGRPVTQMPDIDAAFLEVAQSIKEAADRLRKAPNARPAPAASPEPRRDSGISVITGAPRSSNLRLSKSFTDRDKDQFKRQAFDYICAYFTNSLAELTTRNSDIDADVRRINENRFTAAVYKNGKAIARCTVFMGGEFFGGAIAYVHGETEASNTSNESLSIKADDEALYLSPLGISMTSGTRSGKLSMEGAAELFWSMFIQPLQRRG